LLDQEKQKLRLNAYFGVPDETAKAFEWLSLGEAVCGCSAQQRKRIICENIPNGQDHRADLVRSFGVKAYCANPIFSDDKVVGTLSFGSKKKGCFSEDELSLMQVVTAQVSVAMSRKKTEEILKELNETLEKRVNQRTEEVSRERQRLYNVLETLPSYVILLDRDYRVRFANKVFRESFGEDNGRRCHEYLFGKDQECEDCETYKVLKENKPQHWYWTGPNGHDYDIYDFPFKETDGSNLILEMGIDITERKKLEKQLKDSERMITIGQTAGMVGHDIRNPLQAMISDVYLAKSDLESFPDGDAKENISESLDSIQKNVEYINKIVQDLQDYSRPLAPAAKEIDLHDLIEEVLFKNGVPENVEASYKLTDEAKRVTSDADLLKRVLTNLVNNAVQAMLDGGKLTILAYKDKETADLIIDVEDSGCGIPESVKPNLFTPMFTTKSKGQGFGLAVVKRITESMGGTVSFESVVDKGTTFRVRLPPQRNEG
jgi:signal transduction histidine kinase/putative methionine-R-sulfoxide reductase with GAF domain